MNTGEIIKNRREELRLTQEELAERVGYKHKTSINKIEMGKQKIMQDKILIFARALEFTPEQLMGWDAVESNPVLTDQERELLRKFRALDDRGKNLVNAITHNM